MTAGQPAGIRERRPQIVDTGVVAVLDAHDAFVVCRSQAAQDAHARTFVGGHLVLLQGDTTLSVVDRASGVRQLSRMRPAYRRYMVPEAAPSCSAPTGSARPQIPS